METLIIKVKNKKEVRKLMQISADNGWDVRSHDQMLVIEKCLPLHLQKKDYGQTDIKQNKTIKTGNLTER
jgi:hypothetical protein